MSQTAELVVKLRQVGGEQLTQLAGKLNNLGKQTAAASTDFKKLADELRKTQATSVQSINNLKGYSNAWREIANSVDIASREFKEATAEAAKLDAQLEKLSPAGGGRGRLGRLSQIAGTAAAGGIFGGVEGMLGGALGGAFGGVAGAAVGAAVGGQVGMIRQQLSGLAEYNAELNKQRIALQLVTKDANSFAQSLSFIDQTSRQFAIPQELITRQFTKLSASVLGAGGNVKDAEKAFLGIAAGIRGTGGSLQDMDAALTATAQVFSKGKVSAEELRQQIGERLPGAFTLFAKSIGMTPQELDKALENGKVSLQDFQKFAEELFKQYGKNAEIIAKGPQSAGDRLQTALSRLSESAGRLLAPIGAAFQTVFAGVVEAIDRAAKALARFMGMKFYDPGRINDLKNRIKNETALIAESTGKQLTMRQNAIKELRKQLQAEEKLRPTTGGGGAPPSRLPGIVPSGKAEDNSKAEQAARKAQQLLERRLELTRRTEQLQRQVTERIVETREATDALGASAIEAFEKKYNDRVTDAEKVTGDLLSKVFKLSQDVAEAGGKLSIKGIVQDIIRLEDAAKGFAESEYTQGLSNFFVELDNKLAQVTDRIYENARAMQYNSEVMGGLMDGFKNYEKSIGTTREAFAQLSESGMKGVENAIFDLVTTGSANFSQFAASILQDTARMIIQQYVLKSIMQALGFVGGGGITSAIAPLTGIPVFNPMGVTFNPASFAFANGGIMTSKGPLLLKKYAAGGIANSPQVAMFGEGSRPEAYVPLPDGRSIPVTMKGENKNVSVVVNVDAKGSQVQGNESQGKALGAAISAAVQTEIIKQQRPGGLLAGTR
jgi:lambda family phage tail tape measure protein